MQAIVRCHVWTDRGASHRRVARTVPRRLHMTRDAVKREHFGDGVPGFRCLRGSWLLPVTAAVWADVLACPDEAELLGGPLLSSEAGTPFVGGPVRECGGDAVREDVEVVNRTVGVDGHGEPVGVGQGGHG